ncbi:MAG: HNH endonuclease, partial [Candidatus Aenigmarchaeota archaeon]|nr:HNH endonuclease [Candidatus Aenigmarchaeota archaeon]
RDEVVHHINGIRDDNRLENLQIMTIGEHTAHHKREIRLKKLASSEPLLS